MGVLRMVNTSDQNATLLKLYFSILGYTFREPTAFQDTLNRATNERVEHHALFDYLQAAGRSLQANLDLATKNYFNVAFDNKNIKVKQSKVATLNCVRAFNNLLDGRRSEFSGTRTRSCQHQRLRESRA
jgi:hypothetical protein